MGAVSVTSKGQVTIPASVRYALGIKPGAKVTFTAKNGMAQLEVVKRGTHSIVAEGAGMLHIKRKSGSKPRSLLDFDAASLLKPLK